MSIREMIPCGVALEPTRGQINPKPGVEDLSLE